MAGRDVNVPIPRTIEDITPTWMSSALQTAVADVSVREVIGGTATKVLLDIQYGQPTTLPGAMCFKGALGQHAAFMASMTMTSEPC
jgi:hypothetical protein